MWIAARHAASEKRLELTPPVVEIKPVPSARSKRAGTDREVERFSMPGERRNDKDRGDARVTLHKG